MNFDTYDLCNETLLKLNFEPRNPKPGDHIKVTAVLGSGYGRLSDALLVRATPKDQDPSVWHAMELIRETGPSSADNPNPDDDIYGESHYKFTTSAILDLTRLDFRLQSASDVLLSHNVHLHGNESDPPHAWIENDACFIWYGRFMFKGDAQRARQPVDEIIRKDSTANIHNSDGQTILAVACQRGDVALVQHLLENGADPNADGYDAPITFATRHLDAVNVLVQFGADIDGKSDDGRTALMHAVYGGKIAVLQTLLDNGADLHAKDAGGRTAIDHFAK